MEPKVCFFLLALQVISLVSATSRTFAPNDGVPVSQSAAVSGQSFKSSKASMGVHSSSKQGVNGAEAISRGLSRLGSSPPSCEHKCYGCTPCEAIQVPTTSKKTQSHLGINYANYEPEGWKCKCGPSFYSP